MTSGPQSQHEWTIHSLNIHGVFFERWCANVVSASEGYALKSTNYPVEFPPPNGPIRGRESALDIRAHKCTPDLNLTLVIECKKNNPEFVNWIFFPKRRSTPKTEFVISQIENVRNDAPGRGWRVQGSLTTASTTFAVADEARETREDYFAHKNDKNKTKTANGAITDAAYQVALAAQAITHEEKQFSSQLGSSPLADDVPWRVQRVLPVIVTTARLYVCNFTPSDVADKTGEIDYSKAALTECQELVYEYALPRHLQVSPQDLVSVLSGDSIEYFMRMHIVVVSSTHFAQFLRKL